MEAVAQFSYSGTTEYELSFSKGDSLLVTSYSDDLNWTVRNWYSATLVKNNQTGEISKNHIKMKP